MPHNTSLLIESLPHDERERLSSILQPVALRKNAVLLDIGEPVTHAYFPAGAVISLVLPLSTGDIVETSMVGRDGLFGAASSITGKHAACRAVVQQHGHAFKCETNALQSLIAERDALRKLIVANEQTLLLQAQQTAVCNVKHGIESRLARWLLRAQDLHGSDELDLTQEFIAEMLGVRRPSVSMIAHALQREGLLRYSRGRVYLEDVEGLKERSCECYVAVKEAYDSLVAPEVYTVMQPGAPTLPEQSP